MFLTVSATILFDPAPSSFRRASAKNVVHPTCAGVTIQMLSPVRGGCPRLRVLRSRVCVSACLMFRHAFYPKRNRPKALESSAGYKGAARIPMRDGARSDPMKVVSVTQGSGSMVALMPRIFFAVASVGIAVLITALILTALRL